MLTLWRVRAQSFVQFESGKWGEIFWNVNAESACVSSKFNWRRRSMRRDDHLFSFFILTLLRLNRLGARARGVKCSQTSMYRGNFLGLVHTSDGIGSRVGIESARIRNRKRNRSQKNQKSFRLFLRIPLPLLSLPSCRFTVDFFRFRLRFHRIGILIMRLVMKAVVSKPPLS